VPDQLANRDVDLYWLIPRAVNHRRQINRRTVTMAVRHSRAASAVQRTLPGSCKARARIADAVRQGVGAWR
jgi:hypothetical protein